MEIVQVISTLTSVVLAVSGAPFGPAGGYMYGCPFIVCTNGAYTVDARGCRVCSFSTDTGPMLGPGGDPFHQGGSQVGPNNSPGVSTENQSSSMTYDRPCILGISCDDLKCPHGFYNGPGGCQFCICAQPPATSTLSPAPYSNPCPGAPSTCDFPCGGHGFETGANGCNHCKCRVQSGMTSPVPTMSPKDKCLAKMTECQIIHPHGFMMDPACDTCVGKDDIYMASNVTLERQPKVKLPNPCLQGIDVCMIVCETGYKTGPRRCQYCACQE